MTTPAAPPAVSLAVDPASLPAAVLSAGPATALSSAPAAGPATALSAGPVLWGGVGWLALGAAILAMSLRMDRLGDQGVSPYAAPGLVPGLLGIVMLVFAGLLTLRSRHTAQAAADGPGTSPAQPRRDLHRGRLATVMGLCLAFGVVLVGHGLPFWAAAALFVTVAIVTLQHTERKAAGRGLDARALGIAGGIGLAAGVLVTLLFQQLFLVHLP